MKLDTNSSKIYRVTDLITGELLIMTDDYEKANRVFNNYNKVMEDNLAAELTILDK